MGRGDRGIVLVAVLFLLVVLAALLGAFFMITSLETGNLKGSKKSLAGFYAAEAGLNMRAEQIRQIFVGYNRPAGTPPTAAGACEGSNQGAGDYTCTNYDLGAHRTQTWVEEAAGNPIITTIPQGELYQYLNAQEYRYTVRSTALDAEDRVEALLELRFKSRLVPLFQFVAFYDKDLEILPGPTMNLSGPVHTNGDLYMESGAQLNITGQVTTAGRLFRGRKNDASCIGNSVRVKDPANFRQLIPTCPSRTEVFQNNVTAFNGMIRIDVDELTLPEPESIDPTPGQVYWDNADLRLVLKLTAANLPDTANSATGVEVRNADNSLDGTATGNLHLAACGGTISGRPIGSAATFYNNRENRNIRMLEVDMRNLLNCIHTQSLMGGSKTLNDSTEGGLVFYFGVEGPNSAAAANGYGVRIRNAATLQATVAAPPQVRGMTVVTDQAIYTYGDYNSGTWVPAALLADSYNALSRNWNDSPSAANVGPGCGASGDRCSANSGTGNANVTTTNRVASNTSVYAAVMAGTDTTGGIEGAGGQGGTYNGGLENYPRFHEYWSNATFTYRGSFVSLNRPRHVSGTWVYGGRYYTAPTRNWDYDTRFNDAARLPPLTPRFVYLRQELFERDFEQ